MARILFKGLEELNKVLIKKTDLAAVKRIVQNNGSELQSKIQDNANFTRGYATGTTKNSIRLDYSDGGMTAESGPTTKYAPYLEYGTRFMSAQKFVEPSLNEQKQKFKSDMQKLVR